MRYVNMKTLGMVMILVSALGVVGWIGANDPDGYFTEEQLAQYRYCDKQYVSGGRQVGHEWLLVLAGTLGVGVLLYVHGLRSKKNTTEY